jgi:hypothetical protein
MLSFVDSLMKWDIELIAAELVQRDMVDVSEKIMYQ